MRVSPYGANIRALPYPHFGGLRQAESVSDPCGAATSTRNILSLSKDSARSVPTEERSFFIESKCPERPPGVEGQNPCPGLDPT